MNMTNLSHNSLNCLLWSDSHRWRERTGVMSSWKCFLPDVSSVPQSNTHQTQRHIHPSETSCTPPPPARTAAHRRLPSETPPGHRTGWHLYTQTHTQLNITNIVKNAHCTYQTDLCHSSLGRSWNFSRHSALTLGTWRDAGGSYNTQTHINNLAFY